MAKSLAPPPKFTVYYNGAPASGAKVNVYLTGTTTRTDTYSTRGGTVNANPVICDSRGECTIFLTPGKVVDFVVTTSSDVAIYTQAGVVSAGSPAVINVDDQGAVGDGSTDDWTAFVNAWALIVTQGGGKLELSPGKTYYLATNAQGSSSLFDFNGLKGVTIDMNGATILTGTANNSITLFYLRNVLGATIRNGTLQSQYTTLDPAAGIYWSAINTGAKNILFENMKFISGRQGIACGPAASVGGTVWGDAVRSQGITAINCEFSKVYYPQSFQGQGDDYFARGIRTINCGRGYFPWNVRNHDVRMYSEQGGPFDDCLLKAFYSATNYSKLENIKLDYTSPGRYAGAGAMTTGNAVFNIAFQQESFASGAAGTTPIQINDIDIHMNIIAGATDTMANIALITKTDSLSAADATVRGYITRNIKFSGKVTNNNYLSDAYALRLFSVSGGMAWTSENTTQTIVRDFNCVSSSGSNNTVSDIYFNGQANASGQNLLIDNATCNGNYDPVNVAVGNIGIHNSTFNNLTRFSSEPVSYTPTITGPSVQTGLTATAKYVRTDGTITVNGVINVVTAAGWTDGTALTVTLPTSTYFNGIATGSFYGLVAGVYYITGTCVVATENTNTVTFMTPQAGDFIRKATFAWADGSYIKWSLTYNEA